MSQDSDVFMSQDSPSGEKGSEDQRNLTRVWSERPSLPSRCPEEALNTTE